MAYEHYLGLRAENLDESSRLRYRAEIQQALAEISVKKTRLEELQSVIDAVNADSDAAAAEHSAECEPRQTELAALDQQHMSAILKKKPVPKDITDRRVSILQQIADANSRLEIRVDANKKTAGKLQREWNSLRMETTVASALENSLLKLAPRKNRLERELIGIQTRAFDMVSDELQRLRKVAEHNVHVTRDLNKEPHKAAPYLAKLEDYDWMLRHNATLRSQLLMRDQELHRAALCED